jgi:hypothetical protein
MALYKWITDRTDCELPLVLSIYFLTNNVRKVHEILEQTLDVKLTLSSERYQYFRNVIVELFPGETLFRRIYQSKISKDPVSLDLLIALTTELLKGGTIDLSRYDFANAVVGIIKNASPEIPNLVDIIDSFCISVANKEINPIDIGYLNGVVIDKHPDTLEAILLCYYLLKLNKLCRFETVPYDSKLLENIRIRPLMVKGLEMYAPIYPKLVSLVSFYAPEHFSRLNHLINLSIIERKWFRNLYTVRMEQMNGEDAESVNAWLEVALRSPMVDTSNQLSVLLEWMYSSSHTRLSGEYFVALWNRWYIENPHRTCTESLLSLGVSDSSHTELLKNPKMLIDVCEPLLRHTELIPVLLRVIFVDIDNFP